MKDNITRDTSNAINQTQAPSMWQCWGSMIKHLRYVVPQFVHKVMYFTSKVMVFRWDSTKFSDLSLLSWLISLLLGLCWWSQLVRPVTINQQEPQETAPPCTILRTSHCRMRGANRSTLFPIQAWQNRKGWKPISRPLEAGHVWNLTLRWSGSSGWLFRHHWIMAAESRNCQPPNRFWIFEQLQTVIEKTRTRDIVGATKFTP